MASKSEQAKPVKPPRARARKVLSALFRDAFAVFEAESVAPDGPEHQEAVKVFDANVAAFGPQVFELAREAHAAERS